MITENRNDNFMEIRLENGGKLAAYGRCLYHKAQSQVQITDLFAEQQGMNFEDLVMDAILSYAEDQNAETVIGYPGSEPYSDQASIPPSKQVSWYQEYGFQIDHLVAGATPCMVLHIH